MSDKTLIYVGVGAAAYFLVIKPALSGSSTSGSSLLSSLLPSATPSNTGAASPALLTTYPYLVANAPPIPTAYDDSYYKNYIYPAMLAADGNVGQPKYTISQDEANNYGANYTDVAQWANNTGPEGGARHQTPLQAYQYHWHTYGVPEQRTFLPLPWNDPANWVPPPPSPKSGLFKGILIAVTAVAAGVVEVVSVGTLTPVVAPAAAAAITAESQINGANDALSNEEIAILLSGAYIINEILPFYNQAQPTAVRAINAVLQPLLAEYAVPPVNPYKNYLSKIFNNN